MTRRAVALTGALADEQRQSLKELVLDLIRAHGEPTKEERAWARGALAARPSKG